VASSSRPGSITRFTKVFAGNEIDRSQVQQAVALLTGLAKVANGGLTLISHPSLTGIKDDTGLSGSTQWHNAVRARLYTKSEKQEEGAQPTSDIREIVFKKNQYGPIAATVRVQYRNGVFVPIVAGNPLERAAADALVDDAFLACLDAVTAQGRSVSHKPSSMWAPTVFEKMAEAAGHKRKALDPAMQRLFSTNRIKVETSGPPSKRRERIVRC
jgi:RecA-family ATPase